MSSGTQFSKKHVAATLFAVLVAMLAVACGSDSGASGGGETVVERVVDDGRTYTVEDIRSALGVKVVKDYDVDELPEALEAWNAIYNQLDHEIRFYASHADAVEHGTLYADSVTGADAVVTGDGVLWEEGRKDRRKCSRAAQTPHSSCSYSARYLEYIIRGNMILFCEGDESSEAFANCESFMKLTEPAA
ncbi:DUF6810 family protein [Candidatus Lucifugimonas marina]|uniref:DUF6810 domain-containing protein n=1 Tax=Candidatus Lucifugimonas marina TaxID=3038979 RepID=A0AAJ5ZDT9_9CHLR|nr:hypothetical protein [SAR202 cluster bacterium JH702]MDG0869043.1 hypothetical protein [SAR202 cluster bacterium JH639]WFG35665.1 hypothetical protein GKN94_08150 [SAR202 cluster bacterium JH545]WFG39612.1 hypothetical protein GKO48_08265 [SAR202 cluster bacterium JH1073]